MIRTLILDGSSLVRAFRRLAVRAGLWAGFGAQWCFPLVHAGETVHVPLPGERSEPCLGCGRTTERVGCVHNDYQIFGASGGYTFCRACAFYLKPPLPRLGSHRWRFQ